MAYTLNSIILSGSLSARGLFSTCAVHNNSLFSVMSSDPDIETVEYVKDLERENQHTVHSVHQV